MWYEIPIWFQNTVCPKTNLTLFHKYKLELATGIHTCIGHVLCKNYRVFKRYHDDWRPRKRRMEKWIHIFSVSIVIIPTRLLCQMQANSSGAEFLSTISKFMKRMNFVIACLRPSQNMKLGIFTGSRAVDGKEMYKKVWRTCKVAVLRCQAIAYLTFSSLPHLKLPIYDTLWSVKNRIISGQIELLLLIASQMFFRLIAPSFLVRKDENISFPSTHKLGERTGKVWRNNGCLCSRLLSKT